MPLVRWDVSIYYTDNPESLEGAGKSLYQACGHLRRPRDSGCLARDIHISKSSLSVTVRCFCQIEPRQVRMTYMSYCLI